MARVESPSRMDGPASGLTDFAGVVDRAVETDLRGSFQADLASEMGLFPGSIGLYDGFVECVGAMAWS